MKNLTTILAIILSTTLLFSCKKDKDDPATTNKSKEELLLGTWAATAITSDKPVKWDNNVEGTDGYTYKGECIKSTTLTFSKGTASGTGSYILYDACDKSNSNETWILQNDVITLAGDDFMLEQLDNSTLKFSYTKAVANKETAKITNEFKRK